MKPIFLLALLCQFACDSYSQSLRQTDFPAQDVYTFQICQNGKMVEVEDALFVKGTRVQQYFGYSRNGLADGYGQMWLIIPAGRRGSDDVFNIVNFGFLKFLQAGDGITVQEGSGSDNQLWALESTGRAHVIRIRSVSNGRFLQIANGDTRDGTQMTLGNFSNLNNQLFAINTFIGLTTPPSVPLGVYAICSAGNDAYGFRLANSRSAPVMLTELFHGAGNQQWRLESISGRFGYMFAARFSPEHMQVANGSLLDGAWIIRGPSMAQPPSIFDPAQWMIIPVIRQSGKYVFFKVGSGKCMTADASGHVVQMTYTNNSASMWKLKPML